MLLLKVVPQTSFLNELHVALWTGVRLFAGVRHLMTSHFTGVAELFVTVAAGVVEVAPVPLLVGPEGVGGGVVLAAVLALVHDLPSHLQIQTHL